MQQRIEYSTAAEALRAWGPLVASGYEVPAAGQVMLTAADQMERLSQELSEAHAMLEQQSALLTLQESIIAAHGGVCSVAGELAMEIAVPESCTRVIGESQGYQPLPVRDEGWSDGSRTVASAWRPSPEALEALTQGGAVVLRFEGSGHPPLLVTVAPASDSAEPSGPADHINDRSQS